jgi:DNA repair exonuclease SbcCD ATPase subunit
VNPEKLQADQERRDVIAKTKIGIEAKLEAAWEIALPIALLGESRSTLHLHLTNEERKRQWEERKSAIEPKIPGVKASVFDHAPADYLLDQDVRAFYGERLERALRGLFHPPPEGVEQVSVFVVDRSETSAAIRQKLASSVGDLAELVSLNDQLERHEADLRDLDYEIRQQAQDAVAIEAGKTLHTRRGELLATIAGYEKQIAEHEAEITRLETRLVELRGQEKQWRDAENKASQGRSVLARAHAYRDAAHEVRIRAAERLRRKIGETVGELWTDITERDREFKGLEFDSVWQCQLVRPDGRRVLWDEVNTSAGQRQVRLLAFNEALRRLAQLVPPLVVDTPMGRLSKDVREAVVERLYLQGHQSIILSTDTEMDIDGALFAKVRDRFGVAYTLEASGPVDSPDYEVEIVQGKYFGKRI